MDSGVEPGRWAPFPVQDWSRMPPAEPGVPASWPYTVVDPSWGPPTAPTPVGGSGDGSRRPRWIPLVAVVVITTLVALGMFAAGRVGAAARDTGVAYVPTDGQARYLQRDTVVGDETVTTRLVQESARQSGAVVLGGLDWTLGIKVLGVVGSGSLDRMHFWRTTSSEIGNLGSSQQLVRVYRVDDAVELLAESDQGGADVYSPALTELPAEVAAGTTWSGQGTVGARRYRSEFRAVAAEPGCLQVRGTIAETTAAGQPGTARTLERTWCRGRGVVLDEQVRGGVTVRTSGVSATDRRPDAAHCHRAVDVVGPGALEAARLRPDVGRRQSRLGPDGRVPGIGAAGADGLGTDHPEHQRR